MRKFHFIEHPADLAVEIESDSKENLFRAGLEAVIALLTDEEGQQILPDLNSTSISAEGFDDEERLIGLLNELLYICQVKNFYPVLVEGVSFDKTKVNAVIIGLSGEHEFELAREIKAATYHDIRIKTGKKLKVRIVLDV